MDALQILLCHLHGPGHGEAREQGHGGTQGRWRPGAAPGQMGEVGMVEGPTQVQSAGGRAGLHIWPTPPRLGTEP